MGLLDSYNGMQNANSFQQYSLGGQQNAAEWQYQMQRQAYEEKVREFNRQSAQSSQAPTPPKPNPVLLLLGDDE